MVDRATQELRTRVASFQLAFLSLPPGTEKGVALDVFIKLNTSSVKLSTFDILVAQVEAATDESLHALVNQLVEAVPSIESYKDPAKLVLAVAALLQDRSPNQSGYWRLEG